MKNILVFSPHNDDLEIAMGGTALKYIKEGYNIIKIIFSVGELSNPHLKAEKKFGFHKTIFLKLTDAKLKHEIELVREDIEDLIKEYNPEKIFIPSFKDIHPNHRAVTKLMKDIMKNKNIATYGYEVWSLTDENLPKIYVDITPYFKKKIAMIKIFNPTEWLSVYLQYIPIYIRAIRFGRKIKVKYAERFYRIR